LKLSKDCTREAVIEVFEQCETSVQGDEFVEEHFISWVQLGGTDGRIQGDFVNFSEGHWILHGGARRLQCRCRESSKLRKGRSVDWDHEECVHTRGSAYREFSEKGAEDLASGSRDSARSEFRGSRGQCGPQRGDVTGDAGYRHVSGIGVEVGVT
jgi:hypothetical protein